MRCKSRATLMHQEDAPGWFCQLRNLKNSCILPILQVNKPLRCNENQWLLI
uniref:Uncharacterized protein n=1 Tax=Anguilla anguilla TaxID=7936 RepID=A0A0E9P8H6_ANGAN